MPRYTPSVEPTITKAQLNKKVVEKKMEDERTKNKLNMFNNLDTIRHIK